MDPTANLAEQIKLCAVIFENSHEPESRRLAELAEALDSWIRNGGFLPEPWARGRTQPPQESP